MKTNLINIALVLFIAACMLCVVCENVKFRQQLRDERAAINAGHAAEILP